MIKHKKYKYFFEEFVINVHTRCVRKIMNVIFAEQFLINFAIILYFLFLKRKSQNY